ncbi:hypothetical protein NDU88_012978 [Pleurodeles waltl]|uniref:Uncharacterized protein n=1 Tax=Pleurodeles waltl TaxID=8319 RepID=A0AAV7R2C4_PLEWA|nr:hypothetical protein NDU88_012978 [Pleurodeles waltl]
MAVPPVCAGLMPLGRLVPGALSAEVRSGRWISSAASRPLMTQMRDGEKNRPGSQDELQNTPARGPKPVTLSTELGEEASREEAWFGRASDGGGESDEPGPVLVPHEDPSTGT